MTLTFHFYSLLLPFKKKKKNPIFKNKFHIYFLIFVIDFVLHFLYLSESNLYSRFLIFAFLYL